MLSNIYGSLLSSLVNISKKFTRRYLISITIIFAVIRNYDSIMFFVIIAMYLSKFVILTLIYYYIPVFYFDYICVVFINFSEIKSFYTQFCRCIQCIQVVSRKTG